MKAIFVAITMLIVFSSNSFASITLDWQFLETEAEIGQSIDNLSIFDDSSPQAHAQYDEFGDVNAGVFADVFTDKMDVISVTIASVVTFDGQEPDPFATVYGHGKTYYQLAVYIYDQPYALDISYEFYGNETGMVQEIDNFVCTNGDGTVLYPQIDPYLIVWGGSDYSIFLEEAGYENFYDYAETDITARFTPVPVPSSLWLLGSGLVWLIGFFRKSFPISINRC